MSEELKAAVAQMNALPDISQNDSERLQGFTRTTAVEIKAVGGVGAATSLEMIGYIRELEHRLSFHNTQIREVLAGLRLRSDKDCWCHYVDDTCACGPACLAARELWKRVQS